MLRFRSTPNIGRLAIAVGSVCFLFALDVGATYSCKTLKDIICGTPAFETFCDAVDRTGLDHWLEDKEHLTLFAPNNGAFENLYDDYDLDDLDDVGLDDLRELVLIHITEDDEIYEGALRNRCSEPLEMANGEKTRTQCRYNGDKVKDTIYQKGPGNEGGDARPMVFSFNIETCNGVMHVVNNVILPSDFGRVLPTKNPAHKPTRHPTRSPAHKPTRHPTRKPTSSPVHPTRPPTRPPTSSPAHPTRPPTRSPTRSPNNKPTRNPTPKPTRRPFSPTRHPNHDGNASCSANFQCDRLGLEGDCCPTIHDVFLNCCDDGPTRSPSQPTRKPTQGNNDASCSAHPKCAHLGGDCCPTQDDVTLDCCESSDHEPTRRPTYHPNGDDDDDDDDDDDHDPDEGACSAHPKCRELGLKGVCCPTSEDVKLDCCYDTGAPGTCSRYPGCRAEGLTGDCCPAPGGMDLACCGKSDGFPIIDEEYCRHELDYNCYKFGRPECCLKSNMACPKEKPDCDVGFPYEGQHYCTKKPNYGCHERGWPDCCEDDPNDCPHDPQPCDRDTARGEYCSVAPDWKCYDFGWPSCCFGDRDSNSCPSDRPRCDVGRRGCDRIDSLPTIYDFACDTRGFDLLCHLIGKAGLDDFMDDKNSDNTFTFFAPTDDAFRKLGQDKIADLQEDPTGELRDILRYHLSDTIYFEDDLRCDYDIDMLLTRSNNRDTTVTRCNNRDDKFQKGKGNDSRPEIIVTDIVTCNGVVHVLNDVMLP